ncbi:Carboxypeptidase regulatory-like domain-containing protein [Granulicella pectinivorans]|uniref:Carboxypeptidase regulatory-like domain-containing protein n=1 Tax=Granulicella pectinivorans TaxID=474950 RepID=A0A1I6LJ32_9BACT|nr:TonB-dependent receptor [Granulicella pectinivorans]SFS03436.1 Carboxypeptidase regulatory-like domain-containing protein [Granulicella pectinivorans]
MSKIHFKSLLTFAGAVLLTATAGLAQSTTQGAIAGTVFDASNAIVPHTEIVIHNDADGSEQKLTSGDSGTFRAPQLTPGVYTVTFKAAGFSTERQTNVIVQVNGVTEVDPHLTTGEIATSIEVRSETPVLKFDSAEFGGHLDNTEIESIPINNRRWSSLALTTPAVVNDASGFGLLSFRAISAVLNNVEVDGADDNQAFFSEERGRTRAGYSTSQAAVREFQVNTGAYSAEFGRAVGGVVNSVTKSGGNGIHGEAYFYNRNSSRSAFQPFATNTVYTGGQYVTSPYRPKDNRNQIGFGVGGALIKDKLFWFYAFDTYRRNFPGTAKAATPSSFFVAPDATLPTNQACNLATGAVTATGTPTASAADGYACLLAARLKYGSYAAGATAFNTQLQALLPNLGSVPRFGDQNINTPKLDWQVNQKNHVSALYHRLRWDSPGGVQTQGTNNYAIDTFGTDFVKLDYTLVKLDSLITQSLTNEVRYQYGRELNYEGLQPSSAYTTTNLINNTGFAPEVSLLGSTTGFFMGQPYYSFRVAYPDERKWQVGDTATYILGKHSIRFGEDIVHNYDLQNNLYEGNGFVSYTTGGTGLVNYFSDLLARKNAQPGTCGTSQAGVGNLLCYNSYAQGFGPSTFDLATVDYAFFVQDDWKVTPRLTLNLGVRYDYESFPKPYTNIATIPQTLSRPSDKNNFGPRFGFAWDPFGLGKTAVHGGFGLYYGRIPNAVILNAYLNTASAAGQNLATFTPTTAVAAGQNLPTLSTAATSAVLGTGSVQYLDPHLQNPYTEQMDLAVQQDLGFHNVLSVSYLGALGRELPNYLNVNLDPTKTYTYTYTIAPGSNGSCGPAACGTYTQKAYASKLQTGATASVYNNILINPSYSAVTDTVSNINSNYHALSIDVTNRSFKLVTFDANYTWAHALDYSQAQFTSNGTNNWLDPFANQRSNYGTSSLNVRHRAVGWAVINIPGMHSGSALKYATNGWSIKPLVQIQSGLPYSAAVSGTTPSQCYVAGCLEAAGTSGVTATGVTYLPQVGRNSFTLPRTIVVDTRVQKDFALTERSSLQLIGEAFNLANHQNVTGVNTGAYAFSTNTATNVNTMTYQSGFQTVQTANSNYAYSPRLIQIAARLVF